MAPYKLHFAMMSSLQTRICGIHSAIPTRVVDCACRAGDKFSTNAPADCLDIDFSSEVERMTACSEAAEDRLQNRKIKTEEVTNGKNERCKLMKQVWIKCQNASSILQSLSGNIFRLPSM